MMTLYWWDISIVAIDIHLFFNLNHFLFSYGILSVVMWVAL